jgi:Tfp pilus assembly protein PilO
LIEQLKERLDRIPIAAIILVLGAYLAYDVYHFKNDPGSALLQKQVDLERIQGEAGSLRNRVQEVEAFRKSLDSKRLEVRSLAVELEQAKGTLTEDLDVPGFMKMVVAEAERSGLVVTSLKPGETASLEYVMQQTFELSFTGLFAQSLGFFDRLEKLKRIVQVHEFSLKTKSRSDQKYVELEGTVQLRTYRYIGTKADEIGKSGDAAAAGSPANGNPQAPVQQGAEATPVRNAPSASPSSQPGGTL